MSTVKSLEPGTLFRCSEGIGRVVKELPEHPGYYLSGKRYVVEFLSKLLPGREIELRVLYAYSMTPLKRFTKRELQRWSLAKLQS